jgi:hypothetical protein
MPFLIGVVTPINLIQSSKPFYPDTFNAEENVNLSVQEKSFVLNYCKPLEIFIHLQHKIPAFYRGIILY